MIRSRLVWVSLSVVLLTGCSGDTRSSTYLIPNGFVGRIRVQYDIQRSPALPIEAGRYLIRIPITGTLQTSTSLPHGWHDLEDFYYVNGNTRMRLPVKDEPYRTGTTPPPAMVRGGGVGSGTNMPVTEEWFIGTNQQYLDFSKTHRAFDD